MTDLRVLITGGAGFIGSAIGDKLKENYLADVIAVDSLLPQVHPSGEPPPEFSPKVKLFRNDVRDGAAWRKLFEDYDPEYIFHLAAETGTAQSLTESTRHTSVNVVGTSEMLDALIATGRRPKRILLSSSRSIYGEGAWRGQDGVNFYPGRRGHAQLARKEWDFRTQAGEIATPAPHKADVVFPNPSSIYGSTKLAQEHVLACWCDAYEIPLSILRFQNVYGPGQSPFNPYTGIINIFHRIAYNGRPIDIYEDGNIGRDFVFIDDVVSSCISALLGRGADNCVTMADIGTGQVTTIADAAHIIAKIHGAPTPITSGKFRDGDIRWAVADTTAMRNGLGVEPTVMFEQGAAIVGKWLADNGYLAE